MSEAGSGLDGTDEDELLFSDLTAIGRVAAVLLVLLACCAAGCFVLRRAAAARRAWARRVEPTLMHRSGRVRWSSGARPRSLFGAAPGAGRGKPNNNLDADVKAYLQRSHEISSVAAEQAEAIDALNDAAKSAMEAAAKATPPPLASSFELSSLPARPKDNLAKGAAPSNNSERAAAPAVSCAAAAGCLSGVAGAIRMVETAAAVGTPSASPAQPGEVCF